VGRVTPTGAEVALVMFVGMGPVKVLVHYLDSIHDATPAVARRVALRAVGTATITALGLLVVGALIMQLLHFSGPALIVSGGIVLLAYGIRMVIRPDPHDSADPPPSEAALMRAAIYPMGVPLVLNPAGIAAATIFSAEAASLGNLGIIAAIIVGVAIIDVAVLFIALPLGPRLPPEATLVLEQLLGVLLSAVAVELIVVGLVGFGILDLPPRT
jgi:small neutral amino acid transporter SnatA (MarC family)